MSTVSTTTDKTTGEAQATNVKEDLNDIEAVKAVDFDKSPWKDLPIKTCSDSECSAQFRQAEVIHPNKDRKHKIKVKENGYHTCHPWYFNVCNSPDCNARRRARSNDLVNATLKPDRSNSTTATSASAPASPAEDLSALANDVKDLIKIFVKKHRKHKLHAMVAFRMDGVDCSDGAESLLRFPPSKIPVEIGEAAKELLALCYNAKDATGEESTEARLIKSASTLTAAGSKMMAAASEIIQKKDNATERGKNEKSPIDIEEDDEGALEDGKRSH